MSDPASIERARPCNGIDLLKLPKETSRELGELLDLIGDDPESEPHPSYHSMLSDVRFALTGYPDLVEWLDKAPRPVVVAKSVRRLQDATRQLASIIEGLDPESESLVNIHRFRLFDRDGQPPSSLKTVVRDLTKYVLPACAAAREQCAGLGESRGRPRREALRFLLRRLSEIFDRYFIEETQQPAEPVDLLRLDFIEVACSAAGIKLPRGRNAPREILRLARPSRKNRA